MRDVLHGNYVSNSDVLAEPNPEPEETEPDQPR